jgi:hypothetical protein
VHAARKLAFDPFARLPRVASHDKSQGPPGPRRAAHRAHERAAEARDRLVVEGIFSRLSANAVGAK